jgi:hypothetical protein
MIWNCDQGEYTDCSWQPIPKGEMSGLVNINKTNETIVAHLCGEGFLHAGQDTPYMRDAWVMAHTLRTATRLHMYPEVDSGAYTDKECKQ